MSREKITVRLIVLPACPLCDYAMATQSRTTIACVNPKCEIYHIPYEMPTIELNRAIVKCEPWLYYCPYCKTETEGEILRAGMFIQQCQNCNCHFLAMASETTPGRARAVHNPHCDHGCQFVESLGWVIGADCPVHQGAQVTVRLK